LKITVGIRSFEWERLATDSSAVVEAGKIVQSHLLKGQSPTYGPVTARLVEYGLAHLREGHKGHIVEPLAFLSLMRWLQDKGHLSLEANLRSRLGNESERGNAFEEVVNLYLLRALRNPVRFSTIFNFQCRPSWADEMTRMVALRNGQPVAVDVLGETPRNPGLGVPDNATALLIPSPLFGPDVMARCSSTSSNRTVLLMGQFKSYTSGNKESLNADTIAKALTSLQPDHWFKQTSDNKRQKLIEAIEKHDVLRFVGGSPLPPNLNSNAASVRQAIQALGTNVALASLNVDEFRATFKSEDEAKNVLSPMDDALNRRKTDDIRNRKRKVTDINN
ncbi:hypothetical protein V8E52_003500, partial [Russula decolorans]